MSPSTMKAIRIYEFGGPEVLTLEEAPCPQPQAGQVLIQLAAASVNPVDWKVRSGMYRGARPMLLPWIPGVDGAGRVVEVGSDVTSYHPGDAVFGPLTGGYAEYAVASRQRFAA